MQGVKASPELAEIDRVLERARFGLRFPKALERRYLEHYMAQRAPMVPVWTLFGVCLFCLNHMGDISMMAPNSELLFWLRFGVIAPYGLLVIIALRFWPTAINYELASMGIGILGTLLPMSVLAITQTPYAFVYQTGTVGTMLYMVVLLRPRLYAVIVGCLTVVAIQLITTSINGSFDSVVYSGIVTFYVTSSVFLVMAAMSMEQGARRSFLHNLRNELLAEQLRYQSEHDDLTGLKNRRALRIYTHELWLPNACERVASIMIDIDDFKQYNDVHGHIAGDSCLRIVGGLVTRAVGAKGQTFRYGGEEICIVLPNLTLEEAKEIAETVRAAILAAAIPHFGAVSGPHKLVTASLGVSAASPNNITADQMLVEADMALYQAKRLGKNCVYP